MSKNIQIKNKRAYFDYHILDKYVAGMQLKGTEIKSIRLGNAHINEAFCQMKKDELWLVNMHVKEYEWGGTHYNHKIRRERKLLLNKRELKQISKKIVEKGFTVIPLEIFMSERGFAKIEIAVAKGKKSYDKRQSLKEKDSKREMNRLKNRY